jgi:hypothetical protein
MSSSTSSITSYVFHFRVGMANVDFSFSPNSDSPMTDEMAIAFKDAFKNLGWPPGTDLDASVAKDVTNEMHYTEDDTTTPPSFT